MRAAFHSFRAIVASLRAAAGFHLKSKAITARFKALTTVRGVILRRRARFRCRSWINAASAACVQKSSLLPAQAQL